MCSSAHDQQTFMVIIRSSRLFIRKMIGLPGEIGSPHVAHTKEVWLRGCGGRMTGGFTHDSSASMVMASRTGSLNL